MTIEFVKRGNEIYKNINGTPKYVGKLKKKWFITTRNKNHFFVKLDGFGISKDLINLLLENGVKMVKIIYKGESKLIYNVPLRFFITEEFRTAYLDNSEQEEDIQYIVSREFMEEVKIR